MKFLIPPEDLAEQIRAQCLFERYTWEGLPKKSVNKCFLGLVLLQVFVQQDGPGCSRSQQILVRTFASFLRSRCWPPEVCHRSAHRGYFVASGIGILLFDNLACNVTLNFALTTLRPDLKFQVWLIEHIRVLFLGLTRRFMRRRTEVVLTS